jgi:hypothetical protein
VDWENPPAASAPARESGDTFPLLSIRDLASMPAPSYLLSDFIRAARSTSCSGPAASVSRSDARLVLVRRERTALVRAGSRAGPVVYIAAEGVAGLYPRIAAWQQARGQAAVDRIHFIPEATNLLDRRDVERVHRTLTCSRSRRC